MIQTDVCLDTFTRVYESLHRTLSDRSARNGLTELTVILQPSRTNSRPNF